MTAQPPTTDQLAAKVRESHADAMTALGADVHPYSATAIRTHEAELEAALAVLRVRAAAADNLADALRDLHSLVEMDESVGICLSSRAESLAAVDALAAYAAATTQTKDGT